MIDYPSQVTPEALRQEANNLGYTGRSHHADIMRWAADKITELETESFEIAKGAVEQEQEYRARELRGIKLLEEKDKRIAGLESAHKRLNRRIEELKAHVHYCAYLLEDDDDML